MKTTVMTLTAALLAVSAGCTNLRETALAGWLDFVSGSVTDALTTVAPVGNWLAAALGVAT